MSVAVSMRRFPHGEGLPLPKYESLGAAGLDLIAAIPAQSQLVIEPGSWIMVPTGIAIELPVGLEAQIRPRSGLAAKNGVTVLNSPGTIDSDYRGEICVVLINHGAVPFVIERGTRIAQMVVAPVVSITLNEVASLHASDRGADGFGSTGVSVKL